MSRISDFFEGLFTDRELEQAILDKERVEDNVIKRLIDIERKLDEVLEAKNDRRNSKRNIDGNETKRAQRGRPKKVHTD